jgi:DNA-directed RNA polymerase subunit RPC12/RpoP
MDPDIKFTCVNCGKRLTQPAEMAGEPVDCTWCGKQTVVPSPVSANGKTDQKTAPTNKACPFCGEQILFVAKKCKHCGEFLEKKEPEKEPEKGPETGKGTDEETPVTNYVRNMVVSLITLFFIIMFFRFLSSDKESSFKDTTPDNPILENMRLNEQAEQQLKDSIDFRFHR